MENIITEEDKLELINFISSTDKFTNGPKVLEFERCWSDWLDCKNTLFVSSGSTANFLLVSALKEFYGWNNQTKIIVPVCTWMTNVAPIIQLGMKPIFCDVNPKTFTFDVNHLNKIKEQEKHIDGIFVTHLLGLDSEVEEWKKLFPESIIFEDVCESHGVQSPDGSKRGSNTIGATFSTYFGHHMTTIEGGMVCTNNDELYDLMRRKRSHGLSREGIISNKEDPSFWFTTDGYNFRNTEIGAVLGLNQLKRLDDMINQRRENYKKFINIISKHEKKFLIPSHNSRNSSFCFPFVCHESELKNKLLFEFEKHEIEHRPIIAGNLLKHPAFSKWKNKDYTGADLIHNNGIYIGNNHLLNETHFNKLEEVLEIL